MHLFPDLITTLKRVTSVRQFAIGLGVGKTQLHWVTRSLPVLLGPLLYVFAHDICLLLGELVENESP